MYLQFFRVCLWGALFVAAGCGGGTSGTGTGDDPAITIRTYNGTVRSSKDLKPLKNIQVTLENTGDSALTNEAGEFEIVALALPAQLKFLLEGEGVASEVMVDSVEPDAQKVTLALDVGFPYVDSEVACYYRIIAPYLASGGPQVRFLLKTFTAQEYESRNLR